jgi:hypothetical protein
MICRTCTLIFNCNVKQGVLGQGIQTYQMLHKIFKVITFYTRLLGLARQLCCKQNPLTIEPSLLRGYQSKQPKIFCTIDISPYYTLYVTSATGVAGVAGVAGVPASSFSAVSAVSIGDFSFGSKSSSFLKSGRNLSSLFHVSTQSFSCDGS